MTQKLSGISTHQDGLWMEGENRQVILPFLIFCIAAPWFDHTKRGF